MSTGELIARPVPGLGWDALDPREFVRFRGATRDNGGRADQVLLGLGNIDMARALGVIETDGDEIGVRTLGLLLFGREDVIRAAVPVHEVAFQRLSGSQVKVNDFFRWPLLRVMDELEARHRAHNQEQELQAGRDRRTDGAGCQWALKMSHFWNRPAQA